MEQVSSTSSREKFGAEPTFAELWEMCVYKLLYNEQEYCGDIEALFEKHGISKDDRILDVSAGGGFPALGLIERGYSIDCADGFADEVDLFNRRANERGLNITCEKALWNELPAMHAANSYDFLFCRGNSFIYAVGGWNEDISIDPAKALSQYADTAKTFYSLLKEGGKLYIDKFKDTETTHKETVAQIEVDGVNEDLIFWTERFSDRKLRRASMLRRTPDRVETGTPNVSYDLTESELVQALTAAGFNVSKESVPSEQHFDVWVGTK